MTAYKLTIRYWVQSVQKVRKPIAGVNLECITRERHLQFHIIVSVICIVERPSYRLIIIHWIELRVPDSSTYWEMGKCEKRGWRNITDESDVREKGRVYVYVISWNEWEEERWKDKPIPCGNVDLANRSLKCAFHFIILFYTFLFNRRSFILGKYWSFSSIFTIY